MTRWLILAAVLGVAGTASAGDRTTALAFHCSLKAADLISTEYALRSNLGAYETNRLPGMQSAAGRAAWGIGSCAAVAEVDHRLRKHKKSRWALRIVGGGLMAYAVANNARVAQRGR